MTDFNSSGLQVNKSFSDLNRKRTDFLNTVIFFSRKTEQQKKKSLAKENDYLDKINSLLNSEEFGCARVNNRFREKLEKAASGEKIYATLSAKKVEDIYNRLKNILRMYSSEYENYSNNIRQRVEKELKSINDPELKNELRQKSKFLYTMEMFNLTDNKKYRL